MNLKKFLFLVLLSISSISSYAEWKVVKSDNINDDYNLNVFYTEEGYFMCGFNNDIFIKTYNSIFDFDDDNNISALISLYENDRVIENLTINFFVSDIADGAISLNRGNEDNINKIMTHIKTKGNVRIVINRYRYSSFDVTIPMNKNL